MVLHNYQCPSGHVSEKMVKIPLSGKAPNKKCGVGGCDLIAERVFLPRQRDAQPFTPTYYDIDSAGNVRSIMDKNAPSPPGYERRAITTLQEYRKLVGHMNRQDREKHEKIAEAEERAFEEGRKERRAELRQLARHFTTREGKEFAEYAMERGLNKKRDSYDPGVRIEVYE